MALESDLDLDFFIGAVQNSPTDAAVSVALAVTGVEPDDTNYSAARQRVRRWKKDLNGLLGLLDQLYQVFSKLENRSPHANDLAGAKEAVIRDTGTLLFKTLEWRKELKDSLWGTVAYYSYCRLALLVGNAGEKDDLNRRIRVTLESIREKSQSRLLASQEIYMDFGVAKLLA